MASGRRHLVNPGCHRLLRRAAALLPLVGLLAVAAPLAVPSASATPSPSWNNKMFPGDDFDPPTNLYGASMAYDPAIGKMILYGGSLAGFGIQPTYKTFSSSGWTYGSPGPGGSDEYAGYFASMAYDPASSDMVLFNTNGDTWTFDGSTWTEVSTSGPGVRSNASMTFDGATGKMVLFGGEGSCGTACSDTWTWNGSTWTQAIDPTDTHGCPAVCPNSPPSSYDGSMTYDAATGNLVLIPGLAPFHDSPPNGTYTWNGTTWTEKTASLPSGTYLGSMTYDPATGNVVQFGGGGVDGFEHGTWIWSGTTWTSTGASGPSARDGTAMAYDPASRFVMLFGGDNASGSVTDAPWNWGYTSESTVTVLSASSNPVLTGEAVIYSAKVTPDPGGGMVDFTSGGATIPGCGSVTVASATGKARCKITYRVIGSHSILAAYSGHGNYQKSKSAVLTEKVKAGPTKTTLSASANPVVKRKTVTFTAKLSPNPGGGRVDFTSGGTTIHGCGSVAVTAATGKATCKIAYAAAGSHSIVAAYSGDANYQKSRSAVLVEKVLA